MSVSIFFCYAHEDEELLNKLKRHLWPLQSQELIAVWHDRDISAGTEWEHEISQHLNSAHIILLLVSPDFMYSEYCYGVEMKRAIERHQRGEARVIPIILRPVYWQGILGTLQALPTDAKPVVSSLWYNVDEALFDVTEGIRKVVVQLGLPKPFSPSEVLPSQASKGESAAVSLTVLTPQPAKPPSSLKPEGISLLCMLQGHTNIVRSVAFSPDGHSLASSSYDKTINIWERNK
jgi:TIR domain/WD domain, G-beta repeat